MDTNSLYMAILGASNDNIVKPELREEYHSSGKAELLSTSEYHDSIWGYLKWNSKAREWSQ